jgi:hypothetical protein
MLTDGMARPRETKVMRTPGVRGLVLDYGSYM